MNLIAITKIFHIIYNAIFISLFEKSQIKGKFLKSISNNFGIVETNACEILYLYYLILLKCISYLTTLQMQFYSNDKFC